jgi:hypothetical protein
MNHFTENGKQIYVEACRFNFVLYFSFRSPALKPFWRYLTGTDAEQLFSALFRRLFDESSEHYRRALR